MSAVKGIGRPTRGYRLKDGTRVPGVTTITGRYKDSGGLIRWAYNCGRDGIDMDAARDGAADTGSIAHGMIEADIHGDVYVAPVDALPEQIEQATRAFSAYKRWSSIVGMQVELTEAPLVSEEHRFGGTLDALGVVDGMLALIDWKSSNGVYREYIAQVSAYAGLVEECMGKRVTEAHLLRVGKEHAQFAHHYWGRNILDMGWEAFMLMRRLYEYDSKLKKAV